MEVGQFRYSGDESVALSTILYLDVVAALIQ